MLKASKN